MIRKVLKPGYIKLSEIIEGGNVIVSLSERALGRVSALDVKNPITGEVIIKKSQMIDESSCEKIDAAGVKIISVYSVTALEMQEEKDIKQQHMIGRKTSVLTITKCQALTLEDQ